MKKESAAKPTGNFGALVKQYDAFRPSYPAKVLSLIASNMTEQNPLVLDIGCGTGISTRQLASKMKGTIIGCDIDFEMLKMAMNHSQKNVAYRLGDARKIPYAAGTFNMVTAFTAFHWFTDEASLKEIKRVLKTSGKLCTVQPRHTSPHSGDLRMIVEQEMNQEFPASYSNKNFEESMIQAGFTILEKRTLKDAHSYSLDEYLILLQSYSVWNNVPLSEQGRVLKMLKKHFKKKFEDGRIKDTRDIEVLIAKAWQNE